MTYGELKRRLRRVGIALVREGGSHEVWQNPANGRRTQIPRHRGEVPTGTLRSILRQLGVGLEDLQ
ncbi:MAG: type II toxin-antitoxin system HicA family toxin [Dehalococcoidia bacterium]|nr:type II toxin-antitoxin system HicA family toxin [Dehalococcoidia bacterium]MSQ16298.1 type II toxin-antitoxin system HicA family toxin [Dehalococcoidia bacterium]